MKTYRLAYDTPADLPLNFINPVGANPMMTETTAKRMQERMAELGVKTIVVNCALE